MPTTLPQTLRFEPSPSQRAHLAWIQLASLPARQRACKQGTRRHRNRLREQRMGRDRHAGRADGRGME